LFFVHDCFERRPRYRRGRAVNLLLFDAPLGKLCFAGPIFIRTQTGNESKSGADTLIADHAHFLNAIRAMDPEPAHTCGRLLPAMDWILIL
jgi:hypothetical protein